MPRAITFEKELLRKEKISQKMKGRKCPWIKGVKGRHWKLSEETKKRMSQCKKNHFVSKETRQKIIKALTGKHIWQNKEHPRGMMGKKQSLETIRKRMEKISGKNHYLWIEDRTQLKARQERNDSAYQDWRIQIFKRDNFKCKIANQDCSGKIKAHHILGWSDFPELRYQLNNGITLCQAHHPLKRAEEKRLILTFQELVSVSKV